MPQNVLKRMTSYRLYEDVRVTMTNVLGLLGISFDVRDQRHAQVPILEDLHSYKYNFYVTLNGKKYSFLVGDFGYQLDERVVEVYPIDDEPVRFHYGDFRIVLNALEKGNEQLVLDLD